MWLRLHVIFIRQFIFSEAAVQLLALSVLSTRSWQTLKLLFEEEELTNRLNEWKDNVERKGMRVNMYKTKVMVSGERQKVRQKAVRWPCEVCSKGVGSNSLQCNGCQKWVHKKCSGIKGSMSKVAKSFICSGCLNP